MVKAKKKTQLSSRSVIVIVLCFALFLYMAISLISVHNKISAKEAQLAELQQVYNNQVADNKAVKSAIKNGNQKELAEEYARKKGYVMPDERVYVDITPGSVEQ